VPRELRPTVDDTWYIQTDACFEPGEEPVFSGIGAVLFNPPRGERVRFFPQRLDTEILKKFNPQGKKIAIYECEFFALFCSFLVWMPLFSKSVVIYTDNNAVRDTLISCSTSHSLVRMILIATLDLECEGQLTPRYARVPTDSSCADAPLRLSVQQLLYLGVEQTCLDVKDCWDKMLQLERKWGDGHPTCQKGAAA
jgi:hypothetical protein